MRSKINPPFVFTNRYTAVLLLSCAVLLSLFLHWRIFSTDLVGPHVWRQTFTQNSIDAFYEEDNNITHLRVHARGNEDGIHYQEFPLMQWTVAQVYRVVGNGITVTRITCFLIGLIGWLGFCALLRQLTKNKAVVVAGSVMFLFSPLFYYYMINPLPDLMALAAACWSSALYYRAFHSESKRGYFLATAVLGIAVLCKLPYIVFAGIPLAMFVMHIRKKQKQGWVTLLISALMFIPAVWWYAKALPHMLWNPVVSGVFSSAGNSTVWTALRDNLVSSLPELFLNYLSVPFFIIGLILLFKNKKLRAPDIAPLAVTGVLTLLYFLYEIRLISTLHDYYMLPFLPLLFLIAARGWQWVTEQNIRWMKIAAVVLVAATPVTAFLRIDSRWNTNDPGFEKDWLVHKEELRNAAPDDALVIMGNDMTQCIVPYYVHKRGWTYVDSELNAERLQTMIAQGARYLYTDSEYTLRDENVRGFLGREILVAGNVHVFELKSR